MPKRSKPRAARPGESEGARDTYANATVAYEQQPVQEPEPDPSIEDGIEYEDDPEAMRYWATETCRRFVGDDRADEFGERNGGDDEILVRVTPTKYVGAFGVSD